MLWVGALLLRPCCGRGGSVCGDWRCAIGHSVTEPQSGFTVLLMWRVWIDVDGAPSTIPGTFGFWLGNRHALLRIRRMRGWRGIDETGVRKRREDTEDSAVTRSGGALWVGVKSQKRGLLLQHRLLGDKMAIKG